MKYKEGDKVLIKSFEWYNENKDINGNVHCGDKVFDNYMSVFCGSVVTIGGVYPYNAYDIREDMHCRAWTDEMIEGLVDSIENRMKELRKMCTISLTNSNYTDKVEVLLNNYEYIEEDGKAYFVKKKTEYPKTYEECCKVLGLNHYLGLSWSSYDVYSGVINCLPKRIEDIAKKLESLSKLLICRDAYWKIAGDEMGLGEPWRPVYQDDKQDKYCIYVDIWGVTLHQDNIVQHVLSFPTEEMRDAFYENFKKEIEICKELL